MLAHQASLSPLYPKILYLRVPIIGCGGAIFCDCTSNSLGWAALAVMGNHDERTTPDGDRRTSICPKR